jgi:hypothetical protein
MRNADRPQGYAEALAYAMQAVQALPEEVRITTAEARRLLRALNPPAPDPVSRPPSARVVSLPGTAAASPRARARETV